MLTPDTPTPDLGSKMRLGDVWGIVRFVRGMEVGVELDDGRFVRIGLQPDSIHRIHRKAPDERTDSV
jgi:hypothetical protein